MAEAGSIVINLTTKTASFVEGVDKAGRSLHQFGRHAEESSGFLEKFKEGFSIGAGIEAFRASLEVLEKPIEMLKQSFEDMTRIGRDALKFGISADDMSRFQHAANATGVDVGALETGMTKLSEAVGKVNSGMTGSQPMAEAFAKLGLNARELAQADPAETFQRVSEAIGRLSSAYDRAAVTRQLLGRSGMDLLPVMRDLDELMKESDQIGFTRTAEQIQRAEEEERKLVAVTDQFKGLLMDIATSDFVMKLVSGFKEAAHWATEIGDALSVLGGGNPAMERHVAELNRMSKEADDHSLKVVAAATAAHEESDVDKRVEAYRRYLRVLEDQYQLEKRNQAAGVAGANPGRLRELEAFERAGVQRFHQLEQEAAAQHRLNAEIEREKDVRDDIDKTIGKLRDELAGTDKYGSILSRLIAEGATTQQIAAVQKLIDQLREADRLKKEMGDFDGLWKKAQSPLEKYNEQLKELNDLLAHGKIGQEQYARAAQQAKLDMIPDLKAEGGADRNRAATLLSRSFDFRVAGDQGDAQREIVNNQKQSLTYMQRWDNWINQMWQSATGTLASASPDNVLDLTF